ncbi:hypothetical protein TNCV_441211 [Trichonephila clavipes]|nr:hypothetical protein TNCV_441211 [Trichonephila clavipes]
MVRREQGKKRGSDDTTCLASHQWKSWIIAYSSDWSTFPPSDQGSFSPLPANIANGRISSSILVSNPKCFWGKLPVPQRVLEGMTIRTWDSNVKPFHLIPAISGKVTGVSEI